MTYAPHWLFAWGGDCSQGAEIWSNSIRLVPGLSGTFGGVTNPSGALADLEADLRALFLSTASGYSNNSRVLWLKINEIDANGHYASDTESNTKTLTPGGTAFGGAGAASMPLQVAGCVTFKTARMRGKASRGRVFIPQPTWTLNSDRSRFTLAATAAAATVWAQFIKNLGNWPGLDLPNSPRPGVVSGIGAPGPSEPITHVAIGDVPDTQRRRRNNLTEAYSTAALP